MYSVRFCFRPFQVNPSSVEEFSSFSDVDFSELTSGRNGGFAPVSSSLISVSGCVSFDLLKAAAFSVIAGEWLFLHWSFNSRYFRSDRLRAGAVSLITGERLIFTLISKSGHFRLDGLRVAAFILMGQGCHLKRNPVALELIYSYVLCDRLRLNCNCD